MQIKWWNSFQKLDQITNICFQFCLYCHTKLVMNFPEGKEIKCVCVCVSTLYIYLDGVGKYLVVNAFIILGIAVGLWSCLSLQRTTIVRFQALMSTETSNGSSILICKAPSFWVTLKKDLGIVRRVQGGFCWGIICVGFWATTGRHLGYSSHTPESIYLKQPPPLHPPYLVGCFSDTIRR